VTREATLSETDGDPESILTAQELKPPPSEPRTVMTYDAEALLLELEPEVGRLYDRHIKVAVEWFPHDYIPYSLGRDFDKEPWTPDQPRLTGVARTAFVVGLLTEDNLPSYHRLIHGMFGRGDGAWLNWVGRWTAEEGRHAIVLREYLTVTRNLDPVMLERSRMGMLELGYDRPTLDPLRGLAYVAFQEVATRVAHRNTGRYSKDPVADKIMVRIAADENLHATFYRDILMAAGEIYPSAMVEAVVAEIMAFEMPGHGLSGFRRKAASMAVAGIYDLRIHHDQILMPIVRRLRIFEREGLTPAAEAARADVRVFLQEMDASAKRLEEKRDQMKALKARG
jgi:acyl-[acyl-carrier-protein] desaturase